MKAKHIKSLTGVRFVAAMWVVLFHLQEELLEYVPSFGFALPIVQKGSFAVPFFFVLSGYILSYNYFGSYHLGGHGRFVWERFARLWPVHFACLVLLITYVLVVKTLKLNVNLETFDGFSLLPELLMTRSWVSDDLLWNYPAWSIHAEWFAYLLLFPLCFLVFARGEKNSGNVALLITSFALLFCQGYFYERITGMPGKLMSILLPFIAGSALFQAGRNFTWKVPRYTADLGFASAVALLFLNSPVATGALFVSFGVIILGLSREVGLLNRLLALGLLVYGGVISYSLYMTHGVVEIGFNFVAPQLPVFTGVAGVAVATSILAITLLFAALMYHAVEAPANRALRKLAGPR